MTVPPPDRGPRRVGLLVVDLVLVVLGLVAIVAGLVPYERYRNEGFKVEYKGFLSAPESVLALLVVAVLALSLLGRSGNPSRWILAGIAGAVLVLGIGKTIVFDSQHGDAAHTAGFWLLYAAAAAQLLAAAVGGLLELGFTAVRRVAGPPPSPAVPPPSEYAPPR